VVSKMYSVFKYIIFADPDWILNWISGPGFRNILRFTNFCHFKYLGLDPSSDPNPDWIQILQSLSPDFVKGWYLDPDFVNLYPKKMKISSLKTFYLIGVERRGSVVVVEHLQNLNKVEHPLLLSS
jgi:hypothetical protein